MQLTFADEFDTLRLQRLGQPGGWSSAYSWDRYETLSAHTISGEAEIYVDPTFAGSGSTALGLNPFSVANGVLSITATNTPAGMKDLLWNRDYVSGVITTKGLFSQTYGYFEMRADLPEGKGVFPAFWLVPNDESYSGEIDVMEFVNEPNTIWNHIHYSPTPGADWSHQGFKVVLPGIASGFHTFGVLWTAEKISWFVDGQEVSSTATPAALNKPMYMLANLAVGGSWAGLPEAGAFSKSLQIDYIRAYSLDGGFALPGQTPSASPAAPAAPQGMTSLLGGTADDVLTGTNASEYIRGDAGNDRIDGGGGFDDINGNAGADTIHGGDGDDWVVGGKDDDRLFGDAGNDIVYGNLGNDTADGGSGADTLRGGQGDDSLVGGDGNDWISGDRGSDTLVGGAGADIFHAFADAGIDRILDFNAAEGDRLQLEGGTPYTIAQIGADTHVTFQGGADIILVGVEAASLPNGWLIAA